MPAMGGMLGRIDEGTRRDQTVYEQWENALVSALSVAWEGTT